MPKSIRVQVSATELPHFRRLVQFVDEVDRYADDQCDVALQEIVRELRIDFLRLAAAMEDPEDV